jgi:hypothetical protein
MQESSYLGKIILGINVARYDIDPNNNSGIQIFSYIDIPTKYQYPIGK